MDEGGGGDDEDVDLRGDDIPASLYGALEEGGNDRLSQEAAANVSN